jgi:hypothetical protein
MHNTSMHQGRSTFGRLSRHPRFLRRGTSLLSWSPSQTHRGTASKRRHVMQRLKSSLRWHLYMQSCKDWEGMRAHKKKNKSRVRWRSSPQFLLQLTNWEKKGLYNCVSRATSFPRLGTGSSCLFFQSCLFLFVFLPQLVLYGFKFGRELVLEINRTWKNACTAAKRAINMNKAIHLTRLKV